MCKHCAAHVEKALKEVSGVHAVKVDLAKDTATVTYSAPADLPTLCAAVRQAGYEVNE